jgi:hypothetical protein
MKNFGWKTCAIFWVTPVILFICLHFQCFSSAEDRKISALYSELRAIPQTLLILVFFDSKSPPDLADLQVTLATFTEECEQEMALTILLTKPEPLSVVDIHSLSEIRAKAMALNPVSNDVIVLFVSNKSGPTIIRVHAQTGSKWEKDKTTVQYALSLKDIQTMAEYDYFPLVKYRNAGGKNIFISCMKHELGHLLGLEHNDSEQSIMFWNADQNHGQWTVKDLEGLLLARIQS